MYDPARSLLAAYQSLYRQWALVFTIGAANRRLGHRPVPLRELVRVDLEYSWTNGRPRSLEDYRNQFPQLFQNPEDLRALAFEEYRLRRQAGQTCW